MNMKKVITLLLVLALMTSLMTGCGEKANTETGADNATVGKTEETEAVEQTETENATEETEQITKPYEGVKLKWAVSETAAGSGENLELIEEIKEATGIIIEFTIVPNTNAGEIDKALVSLMAGDELDILYAATPKLKMYHAADVLTPLNELAANTNYDMKKIYGNNLPVFEDEVFGLPAFNDIWLTFYNKKVFDDKGVPYPEAEGWTWDKYIETAKLLTDSENDIWGSLMLDYDNYNYMYAVQKGVEPYKVDGTANFDDPIYAEALEFFAGLGNAEKIQPDMTTYASGAYPWNAFATGDNFGMFVCGGWVTSLLKNQEKYPREWQAGILPMPYPEGSEPSTLVVTGNYAIPTTSVNKEAAFEVVKYMAENQYKLGYGRVPARVDLSDEEVNTYIAESLGATFTHDELTVEMFKAGWFDPERILYSEKIIGIADTSINQIWVEEAQMYGMGAKSLEDTMTSIQERSNKAIEEAK